MAGAGDTDGDGYFDVLIGAPEDDVGGSYAGVAHLACGPFSGATSLAIAQARIIGDWQGKAGTAIAAGDIDNDGFSDIIVGAPQSNLKHGFEGATALFYAPVAGDVDIGSADALIWGGGDDTAGFAVAAGDADADGYGDILIGAKGVDRSASGGVELEDSSVAVYLFFGTGL